MTTSTSERSVGQFAASSPPPRASSKSTASISAASGQIPLSDACARKGLDPAGVLGKSTRPSRPPRRTRRTGWPLPSPPGRPHPRHAPRLYEGATPPRGGPAHQGAGSPRRPTRRNAARRHLVYGATKAELEGHLAKEEMVLFPMVRSLSSGAPSGAFHCGSVRNPIRVMCMEHDSAGWVLRQKRDSSNRTQEVLYFHGNSLFV